jgi:hypothetical protein
MEVNFRTKEESNKIQQEEFLKLSPVERYYAFLDLMWSLRHLPIKDKKYKSDNFQIVIESE